LVRRKRVRVSSTQNVNLEAKTDSKKTRFKRVFLYLLEF